MNSKIDTYKNRIEEAVAKGKRSLSKAPKYCLELSGFNSIRTKHLLYNLCDYEDVVYLDVGCYRGSTLVPVGLSSCKKIIGIDNFKYTPLSNNKWQPIANNNNIYALHDNLEKFRLLDKTKIIEKDMMDVTVKLKDLIEENCNVVFFDLNPINPIIVKKENNIQTTRSQLTQFEYKNLFNSTFSCASNYFILVLHNIGDDSRREQMIDAINSIKEYKIEYTELLKNVGSPFNPNGWYNGIGIFIISRKVEKIT